MQGSAGKSMRAKVSRWWLSMSDREQRQIFTRGALAVVCAAGLSASMPMIASANSEKQAEADLRTQSLEFAYAQTTGLVAQAGANGSELLNHNWLRSVEFSLERDPASALSRYASRERDAAALVGLRSFESLHIDRAEEVARNTQCLAEAVYFESRGESVPGQLAVAEVISNRVLDQRYPNSACGVVYQGATRTTGCQFTFTCDGSLKKPPRGQKWDQAQQIAAHFMMNLQEPHTGGATHYHASYVNPVWNSGLVRTTRIGTHIFYRFPRGAEWASAKAAQQRRLDGDMDVRGGGSAPSGQIMTIEASAKTPSKALSVIHQVN